MLDHLMLDLRSIETIATPRALSATKLSEGFMALVCRPKKTIFGPSNIPRPPTLKPRQGLGSIEMHTAKVC